MRARRDEIRVALHRLRNELVPLDQKWAAKHAERAQAIQEAYEAGMSLRQIARDAGVSFERVGQLLRRAKSSRKGARK